MSSFEPEIEVLSDPTAPTILVRPLRIKSLHPVARMLFGSNPPAVLLRVGVKVECPVYSKDHAFTDLRPLSYDEETGIFTCYYGWVEVITDELRKQLELRQIEANVEEAIKTTQVVGTITQDVFGNIVYTPDVGVPAILANTNTDKWRALLKWKQEPVNSSLSNKE